MRSLILPLLLSLCACDMDEATARRLIPATPFDATSSPAAPDYADPASWAALPDRQDPSDLVPAGAGEPETNPQVAVFFVHPTSYYRSEHWNAPIDDARTNTITDKLVLPPTAGVFNGCCRVWAPRYRQATLGAFLPAAKASPDVFSLAYSDVSRAFRYFLDQHQGPFILASHSQGSLHAMRLLQEIDASEALASRLVAAWVPGYRLPADHFGSLYKRLRPCESATDTGCVLAWDTWGEGSAPEQTREWMHWRGQELSFGTDIVPLCSNPISWSRGPETAPASAHRGALDMRMNARGANFFAIFQSQGPLRIDLRDLGGIRTGLTSARCDRGFLWVPRLRDRRLRGLQLGKGNYHLLDYGLFYMDIRENAKTRVEAFLAKGR